MRTGRAGAKATRELPAPLSSGRSAAPSSGPYRINAMSELTGVPRPTLRAWERRYGIPAPLRTASGYRLYAAREIAQVREMRRLCDGGMAAAEAAKLLSAGKSPLGDPHYEAAGYAAVDPFTASLRAILDAIARFDDVALELQLRKATFLGTATAILDHVIAPALREIGRRSHEGELSIAQEHLASQRLGMVMRDLARLAPGADGQSTVVLACFADDDHELGLLDVATRFAVEGLRPIFLGARTPPDAIRSAVDGFVPVLVGLSVTLTPNLGRARELVDGYAKACGAVPWVVGGAGVLPIAAMIRARGGTIVEGPASPDYGAELRAITRDAMERAIARDAVGRASLRTKSRSRREVS